MPAAAPAHHDLPAPPVPANACRWALLLDVDGTLLDFRDDPAAVAVDDALRRRLSDLHRLLDGALALVSGRALADLDRLFGAPWAMAGLHGLELRHADGRRQDTPVHAASLERLRLGARRLVGCLDGVQLEDKGRAIALHCRRHPDRYDSLLAAAAELADSLEGYELQAGNLVTEIKPKGMDKGRAVDALLAQPPFRGRPPVYLGDDLTDEHAFVAVAAHRGWAIRVGDRTPTVARFTLPSPAAVQHWLGRVHDAIQRGDASHAHGLPADPSGEP
ncbi:MAG: trehalose-phosphatase [Xanthomonadaceae bacterium]|nr:trehalose-phosphatase [Xanthomonadaceae bacterium]